jgi:hypothetical protein
MFALNQRIIRPGMVRVVLRHFTVCKIDKYIVITYVDLLPASPWACWAQALRSAADLHLTTCIAAVQLQHRTALMMPNVLRHSRLPAAL